MQNLSENDEVLMKSNFKSWDACGFFPPRGKNSALLDTACEYLVLVFLMDYKTVIEQLQAVANAITSNQTLQVSKRP